MWKNVHTVSAGGIWTHCLLIKIFLLKQLDQGLHLFNTGRIMDKIEAKKSFLQLNEVFF